MSVKEADAGARKIGVLALALATISALAVVYAVHGSMPANAVQLPGERYVQTIAWVPEAWKFFTKNPQEEGLFPLVRENGAWKIASPPGGSPQWAFGLNREGRGIWIEAALLLEGAPRSLLKPCEDEPIKCLDRPELKPIKVRNRSPKKYLCGDVAIVFQKPVPWVWARDGHPPIMESRVIRLDVEC